tara:strand:- start:1862 stop:2020 length:159 start_codon:yes stop_codon:yes gene_type:complete
MGQLVGDASGLQAAKKMAHTMPAILNNLLLLPDRPMVLNSTRKSCVGAAMHG